MQRSSARLALLEVLWTQERCDMSELKLRGYAVLLERVQSEVQSARTRAALAVNPELVELYWRLGQLILDRQDAETYGTHVIDRLAVDLRVAFPAMRGLGRRNCSRLPPC